MNQNKIKYGQLALLLCVIIPASKLLSMPYVSFGVGGRDFWLSATIAFLVDLIAFVFLLWGLGLNKSNLTFKEILQSTLGVVVADVILAIFAFCFFAKFLYVLLDVMTLYSDTFVIKSDWLVFASIALIAIGFVLSRGFVVVGRLVQVLFLPITLSLIAISLFSLSDCTFQNLLPVAENGFQGLKEVLPVSYFSFGDTAILMLLFGDAKKSLGSRWQILLGVAVAGIVSIFVCVVYVALFGELSFYGDIAVARISQFNFNTSVAGRLDWLLLSVWILSIFLCLFTFAHCFVSSVAQIFDSKQIDAGPLSGGRFWIYLLFCIGAIGLPIFVDVRSFVKNFFMLGAGKFLNLLVGFVMAVFLPILTWLANKKTSAKPQAGAKEVARNGGLT